MPSRAVNPKAGRVRREAPGRVAALHDRLAGRGQHELDELLRLRLLGRRRLGVDADRAG